MLWMSRTYFAWTGRKKTIIIEHTMTSLEQVWEGTQFMHEFMLMYVSMLEISIHFGNPFSIYIYLFISVFLFISWAFFIFLFYVFFCWFCCGFVFVLQSLEYDSIWQKPQYETSDPLPIHTHGRKNYNHRHGEGNYLIVRFYYWHFYCALSGKKMYIIVLLNKVNVYYFKFKSF